MRLVWIAAALALCACREDRRAHDRPPATGSGPASTAPAPAAPLDGGAALAPDAAARTTGFAIEPIAPGSPPPLGAPSRAVVIGGARYADRQGPGAVYLLEVASIDRRSIALHARILAGADLHLVRDVKDRADACPGANLTAFAPPAVAVTDTDGDGTAEVGFGYLVGCAGGAITVKQLVLEGDAKYIVRGATPDGGVPEPAADAWPAGALALADAAYRDNAGAVDVADTAAPADRDSYGRDDAYDLVEIDRPGSVEVTLRYPKLPMLARSEAGELTTRMREFLQVDHRWSRDRVGEHTGDCAVTLVTPEVASILCSVLIDTRTRREHDQGTGGSPAGPAQTGFTIWRGTARADVTGAELGLSAADQACPWVLDRDGVTIVADYGADVPCATRTIDWSELAPRSDRAKALVAAELGP